MLCTECTCKACFNTWTMTSACIDKARRYASQAVTQLRAADRAMEERSQRIARKRGRDLVDPGSGRVTPRKRGPYSSGDGLGDLPPEKEDDDAESDEEEYLMQPPLSQPRLKRSSAMGAEEYQQQRSARQRRSYDSIVASTPLLDTSPRRPRPAPVDTAGGSSARTGPEKQELPKQSSTTSEPKTATSDPGGTTSGVCPHCGNCETEYVHGLLRYPDIT